MGNASAYQALTFDTTSYKVAGGTGSEADIFVDGTSMRPGTGKAAILAYTFGPADIASGRSLRLENFIFQMATTTGDGVLARMFLNDAELITNYIPFVPVGVPLPSGFGFSSAVDFFGAPFPLDGVVQVGDTLYVTAQPLADQGDVLTLDFDIVLTPEPASALLLLLPAGLMLTRRRTR